MVFTHVEGQGERRVQRLIRAQSTQAVAPSVPFWRQYVMVMVDVNATTKRGLTIHYRWYLPGVSYAGSTRQKWIIPRVHER